MRDESEVTERKMKEVFLATSLFTSLDFSLVEERIPFSDLALLRGEGSGGANGPGEEAARATSASL